MTRESGSLANRALLCLLRAGLWECPPDESVPFPLTVEVWRCVYDLAVRQTVTGLLYRALHHLPDAWQPDEELTMRWAVAADAIERTNRRMTATVDALFSLMREEGLHPVLMKGQGIATCYEHPLLRECGDIDLFFPNKDEERRGTALMRRKGCRIRHSPDGSSVYRWQGVEVEHHTRLFDLHSPFLQSRLHRLAEQTDAVILSEESHVAVEAPSALSSLLLINTHILKHVLGRGIGLRQFCDLARAYHALQGCYNPIALHELCTDFGIVRWTAQLHAFLVRHIGLPHSLLPFDAEGKEDSRLLELVLEGGNFGLHHQGDDIQYASTWRRKLDTVAAFWRQRHFSIRYAPQEAFWTVWQLLYGNLR